MTREEAIKKLKDILEEATETDDSVCYVTSDDADVLKLAIKALEQPMWTPCSEKPPEESGKYIVTERVFSIDDTGHNGKYNTRVEQVEYSCGKWNRASFFEVTAWKPLPKPYVPDINVGKLAESEE